MNRKRQKSNGIQPWYMKKERYDGGDCSGGNGGGGDGDGDGDGGNGGGDGDGDW